MTYWIAGLNNPITIAHRDSIPLRSLMPEIGKNRPQHRRGCRRIRTRNGVGWLRAQVPSGSPAHPLLRTSLPARGGPLQACVRGTEVTRPGNRCGRDLPSADHINTRSLRCCIPNRVLRCRKSVCASVFLRQQDRCSGAICLGDDANFCPATKL